MDREAWWAIVHKVAKSQTRLKRLSMHTCMHIYMCVCVCVCVYMYIYIHTHIILYMKPVVIDFAYKAEEIPVGI